MNKIIGVCVFWMLICSCVFYFSLMKNRDLQQQIETIKGKDTIIRIITIHDTIHDTIPFEKIIFKTKVLSATKTALEINGADLLPGTPGTSNIGASDAAFVLYSGMGEACRLRRHHP